MQPLADVVKLIFKEDFVPQGANRLLFQLAPMISVVAAVAAVAVIPFGGSIELWGHNVELVGRRPEHRRAVPVRPLRASASTA